MDILKRFYSVADLIEETFTVYIKNIKEILILNILFFASVILLYIPFISYFAFKMAGAMKTIGMQEELQQFMEQSFASSPVFTFISLFFFLVITILTAIKMGAVNKVLEQKMLGKKMSIINSIKHGAKRAFPLVVTLILLAVALFAIPVLISAAAQFLIMSENYLPGGLLLLLALIIYIVCMFIGFFFCMTIQTVTLKEKSLLHAIKYAKHLVRDNYWSTAGFLILITLIMIAVSIALWILSYIILFVAGVSIAFFPSNITLIVIVGAIFALFMLVLMLLPQTFSDVPLVVLYVNREAFLGDGRGEVAQEAAKASIGQQAPNEPPPPYKQPLM